MSIEKYGVEKMKVDIKKIQDIKNLCTKKGDKLS